MAIDLNTLNANSVDNINTNFDRVKTALQDGISRSGNNPNQMNADLDMNSNDILNTGSISTDILYIGGEPVTPSEIDTIAPNSVGASQIIDGSVGSDELAPNSVISSKINDNAVTTNKIANESITENKIDVDFLEKLLLVDPNGPRIPVEYYSATQVQILGIETIAMGGFRYRGRYKIGRAPVFDMPPFNNSNRHLIDLGNGTSTAGDLFSEAYHSKKTWYAQFAAANNGDSVATLGSMPFLRVGSISGNTITLNSTGENERTVSTKTYQFTNNALVGCDVLVISETLNSRSNAFSGRVTKVTANSQTTVTLEDIGSMGEFDFFLLSPPGFDYYCYLNTCYIDTAEVRNIADDGYNVGTRGVTNTQASYSGVLSAPVQIPCDGLISPLASGVWFDHVETVSSSVTGIAVVRYGLDQSHDYYSNSWRKTSTSSEAWTMAVHSIPFGGYYGPSVWLFNTGSVLNISANARQMQIRGWTEL